jgi:hypothetical protein
MISSAAAAAGKALAAAKKEDSSGASPAAAFRPHSHEGSIMTFFTVSKRLRLGLPALVALSLSAGLASHAALAQEEQQKEHRHELRKVCAEDFKKFCNDVQPGGGRIRECMVSNIDKLTPECRAGVEERQKGKEKS